MLAEKLRNHRLKPGGVQEDSGKRFLLAEKLKHHRLEPGGVQKVSDSLLKEKGSVRYYAKPSHDKLIRVDYHGRKEVSLEPVQFQPPNNSLSAHELKTALAEQEQKLLACIHCGLCLEACPTYVITGDENDGPRGRLYLMRAVAEGRLANTSDAFSKHIDRCLGCRACEQVCPAGVEYGQLLEASRHELLTAQPKRDLVHKLLRFALRSVWTSPSRLRFFFAVSRVFRDSGLAKLLFKSGIVNMFSPRGHFALALLENSREQLNSTARVAKRSIDQKTDRPIKRVMLFAGCVGEGLFSRVNSATRRVLEVNGFEVQTPGNQVCCGALHAHAGDLETARRLARLNIQAFGSANEPVITNAGGCGAMLAAYGHLLDDDEAAAFSPRIRDVSQQLETVDMLKGAPIDGRTTYDTSCHLLYGQHAGESSLKMLMAIPNLNFAKLESAERCCGGAGIYNLLETEMSTQVLREKLKNVLATGAEVLATGNPGCQMQIGAGACLNGIALKVCHPVELLDQSYTKAGYYSLEMNTDQNGSEATD
jgi:glycolate oxidase iron-sulfur subunit